MVLVLLFLIAGNFVMLRPGAGAADARQVPAGEDGGEGDEEAGGAGGDAEPVVLEGSGDAVEEFEPFAEVGVMAVEHTAEEINI